MTKREKGRERLSSSRSLCRRSTKKVRYCSRESLPALPTIPSLLLLFRSCPRQAYIPCSVQSLPPLLKLCYSPARCALHLCALALSSTKDQNLALNKVRLNWHVGHLAHVGVVVQPIASTRFARVVKLESSISAQPDYGDLFAWAGFQKGARAHRVKWVCCHSNLQFSL